MTRIPREIADLLGRPPRRGPVAPSPWAGLHCLPMKTTFYDLTVPFFQRGLRSLEGYLRKGAAHAEAQGYDPEALLTARLYPDMFNLIEQVQISTDLARRGSARLAGLEPASVADVERTFGALYQRIDFTLAYLSGLDPALFAEAEGRSFTVKMERPLQFTGASYLLGFAQPNFLFHLTTAYNILRHNGVPLGKRDFVAPFMVDVTPA